MFDALTGVLPHSEAQEAALGTGIAGVEGWLRLDSGNDLQAWIVHIIQNLNVQAGKKLGSSPRQLPKHGALDPLEMGTRGGLQVKMPMDLQTVLPGDQEIPEGTLEAARGSE